ncbi:hypothetical protein J3A83DRAFT_445550 [Scleroderma citrinum]
MVFVLVPSSPLTSSQALEHGCHQNASVQMAGPTRARRREALGSPPEQIEARAMTLRITSTPTYLQRRPPEHQLTSRCGISLKLRFVWDTHDVSSKKARTTALNNNRATTRASSARGRGARAVQIYLTVSIMALSHLTAFDLAAAHQPLYKSFPQRSRSGRDQARTAESPTKRRVHASTFTRSVQKLRRC